MPQSDYEPAIPVYGRPKNVNGLNRKTLNIIEI
jgi:hypothetical protein